LAKQSIALDRKKLRAEAEARFARAPRGDRSVQSTSALLHELQVHQIELEMQNDELRRDQLEIEEAHERQVDLYDFAPVGYLTLDPKGVITGANLTAATLLGKERKLLVGRRFASAVCVGNADGWHRFFSALVQHGEKAAHRLALTRGDASTFDALLVCEVRTTTSGESPVRIFLTDVTEFARLERSLAEVKERFSYVIDGSNDGFWDWDIASGRVKFSRRWAAMFGYDLDELEPSVATRERLANSAERQARRPGLDCPATCWHV